MMDETEAFAQAVRFVARIIAEEVWRVMPPSVRTPPVPSAPAPDRLPAPQGLVTVREVATLLGIPKSRVYELASRRELKVVRIGRNLRFRRRDIDAYIESQVEQPFPQQRPRYRLR